MKLTEFLPDHVDVKGKSYAIYTDFRCGIRHEQMILYNKETTVGDILRNWFPVIPDDLEAALDAASLFYHCGDIEQEDDTGSRQRKKNKRLYDFDMDADTIAASFLQCYNICLRTSQLHWWEFCELLNGLPAKCAFSDRVQIRNMDTKNMKSKDRKQIQQLQRRWKLPETIMQPQKHRYKTLAERNAAMIAYVDKRFSETSNEKNKN